MALSGVFEAYLFLLLLLLILFYELFYIISLWFYAKGFFKEDINFKGKKQM